MKKFTFIAMFMLALVVLAGCGQKSFYSENAISGKEAFKQEESEYLVYFYMPTCTHCQAFKPTLEEYVTKPDALKMYKVNIELATERETWSKYEIEGTPTLVLVKDGKEVERFLGVQELEDIPVKEAK